MTDFIRPLDEVQRELLRAADAIMNSFLWGSDPYQDGGSIAWCTVHDALVHLADEAKKRAGGSPTSSQGSIKRVTVSSGNSHRCVDCSLLRCSAPDNRCPECDRNIKGGP